MLLRANYRAKNAAAAADRASQAKTDFLSTMSHDIRTPMNAIIGLTAIAEKNVEDSAAVKENLHKIGLASNHLLTLINDILDISKVESGKLNLSPASFSIVECAENLVNISQPMVKEKNMNILVAEDNDINWEIISMLLQMQGITCERAENGQLAVDRMARANSI